MCFSEEILLSMLKHSNGKSGNLEGEPLSRRKAFTLMETLAALGILALVSLSVLVVIDRCIAAMVDSELRMQAFEVVRENMEKLLVQKSVRDMVEYGSSETNPDIQWQTAVETFYEPLTSRMWVRATCSAEYTDTTEEVQTVELTHWLTSLTKKQVIQILKQREKEKLANQVFQTAEEAAEYVGVDAAAIQQWIDNGMRLGEDGSIPRNELELYLETGGEPTIEDRKQQLAAKKSRLAEAEPGQGQTKTDTGKGELIAGYTPEELNNMPFEQVWKILMEWYGY